MKSLVFILLGLVAVSMTGCSRFTTEGSGTNEKIVHSETVWQSYYGFDWHCRDVKKASNGLGLYQVTVHNDYLYSLIAVTSLGLVVPQTIEYQCQIPLPEDDDEEEMKPKNIRK